MIFSQESSLSKDMRHVKRTAVLVSGGSLLKNCSEKTKLNPCAFPLCRVYCVSLSLKCWHMLNRQQRQHVSNMESFDEQNVESPPCITLHLLSWIHCVTFCNYVPISLLLYCHLWLAKFKPFTFVFLIPNLMCNFRQRLSSSECVLVWTHSVWWIIGCFA